MALSSKSKPLHLIGGSLGVGKTTAIRRFLSESTESVAVIVNDFGETGYDAGLIREANEDRVHIENVPGGCLCCTSAAQLLPALKLVCSRPDIERIVIEPSGVALLDPLLKMLHDAAAECGFEFASTIVLFDPAKSRPAALKNIPYWKHLVDRADVVVANRCDLASPEAVDRFVQCITGWIPAKLKVVQTEHGKLPAELFSLRTAGHSMESQHLHHAELPPAGTYRSQHVFCLSKICTFLESQISELDRFKGRFHTDQGWARIEIASGQLLVKESPPFTQSSADWIGVLDPSVFESLQNH